MHDDKCPKCGAVMISGAGNYSFYACMSYKRANGEVHESCECLRRQRTALQAENKRLRATIAASDVIRASDTHVATCPECGTRCYMTQDAPCASIQVCPQCNWNERVCRPCVKLAALQEENKQLRVASVEFQANEATAYNLAYDLEAIVDRLPKTADGVPVTPGMVVYGFTANGEVGETLIDYAGQDDHDENGDPVEYGEHEGWYHCNPSACYSTREDAEIAKEGTA